MATIMRRALDAGFAAEGMLGQYVLVSLKNRKPSELEVATALNIPQSACRRTDWGVVVTVAEVR